MPDHKLGRVIELDSSAEHTGSAPGRVSDGSPEAREIVLAKPGDGAASVDDQVPSSTKCSNWNPDRTIIIKKRDGFGTDDLRSKYTSPVCRCEHRRQHEQFNATLGGL